MNFLLIYLQKHFYGSAFRFSTENIRKIVIFPLRGCMYVVFSVNLSAVTETLHTVVYAEDEVSPTCLLWWATYDFILTLKLPKQCICTTPFVTFVKMYTMTRRFKRTLKKQNRRRKWNPLRRPLLHQHPPSFLSRH